MKKFATLMAVLLFITLYFAPVQAADILPTSNNQTYYIYGPCTSGDITGTTMGWYYATYENDISSLKLHIYTKYADGKERDIEIDTTTREDETLQVEFWYAADGEQITAFNAPSHNITTSAQWDENGNLSAKLTIFSDNSRENYNILRTEPNTDEWRKWRGAESTTIINKDSGCNAVGRGMLLLAIFPLLINKFWNNRRG